METDTKRKLNKMLKKSHWLIEKDYDFILSISDQVKSRKILSERQLMEIEDVFKRFVKNQKPSFVRGGSPGLGKKK
jgi:hypothetical protein